VYTRTRARCVSTKNIGNFGDIGNLEEERAMTTIEMLALRDVLADRRTALLDQLAIALLDRLEITAAGGNLPAGQVIDPGFLRLLADLHITIAAVDAALAEFATTGDAP
jgi:hypothetical protein